MNWEWIVRFRDLSKSYIREWGGMRVIFRQDKAAFEADMIKAFDKAKKLSDFIGMVVRLTFLMVFVAYFFTKASSTTSGFWRYTYSTTGMFGAVFTAYYAFWISWIVFNYFIREITYHPQLWVRTVIMILWLYFYWAVTDGIYDISVAIARATKLGQ